MSAFGQKLMKIKWKRYINYIAVSFALILFSTLSLTGSLKQSTLYLLEKMGIAIILSVSLGLVVGFLGELSLGHAGFMCIGAYMGGKTSVLLASAGLEGVVNLLIAVVVGAISAAALGFVVGLPALRLKGDYLAIVTLAFCEIVKTIFENSSTESFSPRMLGSCPQSVIAVVISSFESSEKTADRALGSVFLLCSNAARTVLKKVFSSAGLQGLSL